MLESLAALCRELGHFPQRRELTIKRRSLPAFPSERVFRRFGSTRYALASRLADFCRSRTDMGDVLAMCETVPRVEGKPEPGQFTEPIFGFVYLLKSGRYYKIGKSNAPGRREREVALQLPETVKRVHEIRTDDPAGIEAYWHMRFAQKRLNGEWFNLSPDDIRAFKRRTFM